MEDVYRPGSELDIPRRPQWTYSMTKQQLDTQEESTFHDYLSRIHSSHRPQELSHFEHNLEVHVYTRANLNIKFNPSLSCCVDLATAVASAGDI